MILTKTKLHVSNLCSIGNQIFRILQIDDTRYDTIQTKLVQLSNVPIFFLSKSALLKLTLTRYSSQLGQLSCQPDCDSYGSTAVRSFFIFDSRVGTLISRYFVKHTTCSKISGNIYHGSCHIQNPVY